MATAMTTAADPMSGSLDLVLELIWQHAMNHLKSTKNEILLPADIDVVIGLDNVEKIKDRLSMLLSTPVVSFKDNVNGVYRIMPTPALDGVVDAAVAQIMPMIVTNNDRSARSPKARKMIRGKPEKIPRPSNAFILYRRHHHPLVKASNPDFHNNDISILLGKRWKAESSETKAYFKALADEIKAQHAKDHPYYQYAPRKPSEKKRRSTTRCNSRIVKSSKFGSRGAATPISQSDGANANFLSSASDENNILNVERNFNLLVPLIPSPQLTNMSMTHTTNYVGGFGDTGFMNMPVRRPVAGNTAQQSLHSNTSAPTQWVNLDFDLDQFLDTFSQ
ncbi:uncharacterized protein PADG_06118 [Paracoccidioides brasiliensis Pb18]|uniref:HMG box domain-containing protein n=4 Tax=Paracoccidioides brasiliensis TaxID=121759 RepID=C1GFT2_PARBD|nr:uncharacterized protein PADG_06118 [Paracoccidioides brasiliensis Pb18]EEH50039.1 hypothetical protein PADG_06118 [Paracoccidioides brasiliensis Pb18]ODH12863.1 hypothetical protein ACO22_07838 [Paracoccidioides brasiliensis]